MFAQGFLPLCPRLVKARQGSPKARFQGGPPRHARDGLVGPPCSCWDPAGLFRGNPDATFAVTSSRQSNVTLSHFLFPPCSLSPSLERDREAEEPPELREWLMLKIVLALSGW